MKTSSSNPFSSVWGRVTNVQVDPQTSHDILVTIAGQVLRFPRIGGNGLEALGLLRLTNKKVFLIFGENKTDGKNFIFAGWKNPQNKVVLSLQSLIIEIETFGLMKEILKEEPDWKAWEGSFDSPEVNQKAVWS